MLSKNYRLNLTSDFRKIKKYGQVIAGRLLVVSFLKLSAGTVTDVPRFGFIVGRTIEKRAVYRNRIRRRLSETVRTFINLHKVVLQESGIGVVLIARKQSTNATYEALDSEVNKILSTVFKL